jgi:hypothetical protein
MDPENDKTTKWSLASLSSWKNVVLLITGLGSFLFFILSLVLRDAECTSDNQCLAPYGCNLELKKCNCTILDFDYNIIVRPYQCDPAKEAPLGSYFIVFLAFASFFTCTVCIFNDFDEKEGSSGYQALEARIKVVELKLDEKSKRQSSKKFGDD